MWQTFTNWVMEEVARYGYLAVFIGMVLESACIPIPSEIIMPFGGLLAARGQLNFWWVGLLGALANVVGSWLAYLAGRFGGRAFIEKYGKYLLISRHHLQLADRWFEEKGEITVFVTRLLPGIRTFISLPAGIARMDFLRFTLYSLLGVLPWSYFLAYLGYLLGENWDKLTAYLHTANYFLLGTALLVIALLYLWQKKQRRR
ncbi:MULTISPECIES: DedA family protein [Carboxydocella]|uniref:Membrane protein DedA, SNARE-associated domain n=2 Tax=Carboxydocella TaxID=178898 RepID=A0A1T4NV77_9FIRM|nr:MULTISPECIES: DedA family protein [Carboxydocella]AVX20168.1 membrane protein DedA, SNARE-associated domain [Carboxydocella thermautotrophica]AVX30587.1 membrane protein DedA, SNARE-associated domain [Carboxydocella thermautotrophica]SJZ83151.1 membrane protein DedA, SNARE-associated domain [Carboxydocella sporoproducens DSM 16521]